jgi:hypothetical protein
MQYESYQDQIITLKFALTKGEGKFPNKSNFSQDEVIDIRKAATFYLDFYPDNNDFIIESCKIIYDGISYSKSLKCGLYFQGNELHGHPSPIIQFKLSKPVEPETFKNSVWMSRYLIKPWLWSDSDAFFFEDHNGYTSVIENFLIDEVLDVYNKHNLISSKIFDFHTLINGISCYKM